MVGWNLHATRVGKEGFIVCDDFRKTLKNNFYPHSFYDKKRSKFINLHGNMAVAEYEKRFTKLAKYVLAFVVDEMDKFKQFEEDLKIKIKMSITTSMD